MLTTDPSGGREWENRRVSDRSLPTGIVTFLLTDVVDSTALWDREPQLMEHALARHDEIIEAAVKAYDGVLLKARGEGDSTFSVFARASAAVHAACAAAGGAERGGVAHRDSAGVFGSRCTPAEATERKATTSGRRSTRAARIRSVCEGARS